jgi:alcohol dehydrogenase (cytochrome c)/quinohemoprotein ethanol dehydrogenase
VFQGNAVEQFVAYSADTGKQLWSFPTQTGVIAAPMTYSIDGEQYVAIMAGWGGVWDLAPGILSSKSGRARNISRLLVFKLGGDGELPAAPPYNQLVLDPPAYEGSDEQLALGTRLFQRYCSACHGDAAIAGALVPDLRMSGALGQSETIRAIVVDGLLHDNGMVSFASEVDADGAEAIRQYVIYRANQDKALQGS